MDAAQHPDPGPDPEQPGLEHLDPAQMLALLQAQRSRTATAVHPDPRLLFGAWGIAWSVGFLAMWSSVSDASPVRTGQALAGTVFATLLTAAAVLTGVHLARRTAGVRGHSSRVGAMFGAAWFVSFGALFAVMSAAYAQGLAHSTAAILWTGLSALVVGALYMAGGAIWQDTVQFALGVWIVVSGAVSALAGFPSVYLVMALAGGGGFLVVAGWAVARGPGRSS